MEPDLSTSLLFVFIPAILALALTAPLHYLLVLDLVLVVFPGQWLVSGVSFDVTDLIMAGIALGVVAQPTMRRKALRWRTPSSQFWLFLGVIGSLACISLLLVDLLSRFFPREWYVFQGNFDFGHLVSLGIALWLVVEVLRWKIPYVKLWTLLAVLVSLAYAYAPINSAQLTSPLAVTYQLYRYCWRPILFYPLACVLLDDRGKLLLAVRAIVICGAMCSVLAFSQGYAGVEVTGPFRTKNLLGGALIMPFVLSCAGLFDQGSRLGRGLSGICFLLMARGLLFSGSRGAFVAVFGSMAFLMPWLLSTSYGRSRTARLVITGTALALGVLALKPDLLERPNVQHLLTASRGTEADTMRWRMEERWPHFWQQALDNFWLGTGTDVDPDVGEDATTPHNGYLGVAVVSGIPSLAITVVFAVFGVINGLRVFRRSHDHLERLTAIAAAAAIVGLLIHNIVDETFRLPFAMNVFWILSAIAVTLARRPEAVLAPRRVRQSAARPGTPAVRLSALGART